MATLTGRQEKDSYGELLTIGTSVGDNVDGTLRYVIDGEGNQSALKISTTDIKSDGGIFAGGTFGAGTAMPDSGARTAFYWYPKKAAFRSGTVTGTQWDDSNIGNYSIASGHDLKASGPYSASLGGSTNIASGSYDSVLGGNGSTASGGYAAVIGGATNTASGANSFIGCGASNTASGIYSVCFGDTNTASGAWSACYAGAQSTASEQYAAAFGGYALADKYGQVAFSNGAFSAAGDAQHSLLKLQGQTSNGTATQIFLNGNPGSPKHLTIPSDTTWMFEVDIVARRTDADNESAAYKLLGCIDRNGAASTTALVGSVTKTVIAEDTAAWDVDATADTTNGALKITVTGQAAKSINWVARVKLVETTG